MKDALERGRELFFDTQWKKIPKLAQEFVHYQTKRFGLCGEVVLTCLIVYAECAEKLPRSKDDLYQARAEDIRWFKEKMNE